MQRRRLVQTMAGASFALAGLTEAARAGVVSNFSAEKVPADTMNRVAGWDATRPVTLEIKGKKAGAGHTPLVIAPTTAKTPEALLSDVKRFAAMPELSMIEVRIDYLGQLKPEAFAEVTKKAYAAAGDKIVLVTLRNGTDGGPFVAPDDYYEKAYRAVLEQGRADVVDFELFRNADMVKRLVKLAHAKGVKVIVSDHEFGFTPSEAEIMRRLQLEDAFGADILKIAVMAKCPEDALTLMSATAKMRHYHTGKPMLTMAMGKYGVLTRITGEGFGSDFTFASVGGKASAPGQIPAQDCAQVLKTLHAAMNP